MAIAANVTGSGQRLVPFGEFIASVAGAQSVPQSVPQVAGAVAGARTFADMKSYVSALYASVDAKAVSHSFVDANDTAFDCIPVSQQPALRGSTQPLPNAPDIPIIKTSGMRGALKPVSPLSADQKDRFGNAMACATRTIPMARITLDGLAKFTSLDAFFRKSPNGGGLPPLNTVAPAVTATHRYAHAYQSADNLGGHSYLNVWAPAIWANQIFSLSQHWYVGGSGSGLQTAEVGWQVYPQLYSSTMPVFFIYWTADGYNQTGCYNLTCGAFVQTNSSWAIGGALSPSSTLNGPQYEVEVAYYLYQGNWWLYVNGTTSDNAIGYYPGTIYNGGALSNNASYIDYGGEVVGTTSFPPMGSGQFASAGYGNAAYQRTIYYFTTTGGASNASLTASQQWPDNYTAVVTNYLSPWNETLFFGGPGETLHW